MMLHRVGAGCFLRYGWATLVPSQEVTRRNKATKYS